MYSVLIVDDEAISIRAIKSSLDWESIGIGEVLEANRAAEARELLSKRRIDILICDIEMPGGSGLDLVEWTTAHVPDLETVFLTCHSEFPYAQRAVQLGSLDYLLKPVDHGRLTGVLEKALSRIAKRNQMDKFTEEYSKVQHQWQAQLPLLVERFWQDIFNERIRMTPERLAEALEMYKLPLTLDSRILPILISVEEWKEEFSNRDEEILAYGIRNAAGEMLVSGGNGTVIQTKSGTNLALLYDPEPAAADSLKPKCESFRDACNLYFRCKLSCYAGEAVNFRNLIQVYQELLEMEHNNVSLGNCVLLQRESGLTLMDGRTADPQAMQEIEILFELGESQELQRLIDRFFDHVRTSKLSPDILSAYYHGFLRMMYLVVYRKGLVLHEVFDTRLLYDYTGAVRSVEHLRSWLVRVTAAGIDYFKSGSNSRTALVEKVKDYIGENLGKPFSREELADHVFLNPAYLSRLFRKETGLSLSEYIIESKMALAKRLLKDSSIKINEIAERLGYENFSHFTRLFKKVVGIGPQQYRRRNAGGKE